MATSEQIKILDKIQKKRDNAKANHKNAAEELSGGQERYRAAINTISLVGTWAMVVSIILMGYVLFTLTYNITKYGWYGLGESTFAVLIMELIVFIVTMALGYKLSKLDSTPTFALVSLIIILVANLCLASGIFPLVIVVLAIVGLVRWSTYKSWFYSMGSGKVRRK